MSSLVLAIQTQGNAFGKEEHRHDICHVMTDYWKPYELFLPPELHTQSKAETFTVEGYNSLFRHFLARLRRKSKCYSKCMKMLLYSVTLLMLKRDGKLGAILN